MVRVTKMFPKHSALGRKTPGIILNNDVTALRRQAGIAGDLR